MEKHKEYHDSHPHGVTGLSFKEGEFNVLALQVDEGGCGWYRVRQYMKKFNELGIANTHIIKYTDSEEMMAMALELSSVVIARNGNGPMVRHILSKDPNKKIVLDQDDNTFKIEKFNEHYLNFGTKDVWEGEIPLYVTGITPGFDRFRNLWNEQEFMFMLRAAKLTTSPVENLSELWGSFNGFSAVVPNGIDFELYPDVTVRDNKKGKNEIRIGWHGGISHLPDIGSISSRLTNVLKKNENTMFYTTGAHFGKLFKGVDKRIVVNSWTDFRAHPLRMKMLDLDVAIIPLADNGFNDFKSEVKFSECAALKIPALVVDRLPYSRVIENGVNCLTYKTPEEFESKLEELIGNESLRKKLVKNAYEWVREERNMDTLARDALELYKTL